jgi:hypothetical protein
MRRETPSAVTRAELFREVNDHIFDLVRTSRLARGLSVICECGNATCVEALEISTGAFERIRRLPLHFVVKDGHQEPRCDRVVERGNGYVVVEKRPDAGA